MPAHGQGSRMPRHHPKPEDQGVHHPGGRADPIVLYFEPSDVPPGGPDRPGLPDGVWGMAMATSHSKRARGGLMRRGQAKAILTNVTRARSSTLDALVRLHKEAGTTSEEAQPCRLEAIVAEFPPT